MIDGFGADFTQSELAITPRDKRFPSYSVTGDMPEGAKVAYEAEGSVVTVNKDGMLSAKEAGPRVGLLFHSARASERGQALN